MEGWRWCDRAGVGCEGVGLGWGGKVATTGTRREGVLSITPSFYGKLT